MKHILAVLATTLSLSAVAQTNFEQTVDKAENTIRDRLLDPESARFEEVAVRQRYDGYCVQGLVRAKNQLGGYAGRALWYVLVSSEGVVTQSNIAPMNLHWRSSVDEKDRAAAFLGVFEPECNNQRLVYVKGYGEVK